MRFSLVGRAFLRDLWMWLCDAHTRNVLVGPGGIKIIDLEDACVNEEDFPAENGPEMLDWIPELGQEEGILSTKCI